MALLAHVPGDARRYLKIILIVAILCGIGGYGFFRAYDLLLGPSIDIQKPLSGIAVPYSLVEVEGVVRNASAITLNGRPVFTDEAGVLREETLLTYGYNIVEIRATDKFGRQVVKTLELVYK